MNETLRPVESASIDEGLRTRLEGDVELLEDSLPLLASTVKALRRREPTRDDLATLQECVAQLPRIDEALERVGRHEAATLLTRTVGLQKKEALAATALVLPRPAPSLRESLTQALDQLRQFAPAPLPSELTLLSSSGAQVGIAVIAGVLIALGASVTQGAAEALFAGVVALGLALFALPSTPWRLLPDRLYFPPRRGAPARQVPLAELRDVRAGRQGVEATWRGERLELRTTDRASVEALLPLLTSRTLGPLVSPCPPYRVVDAVDAETQAKGTALLSADGLLFVEGAQQVAFEKALGAPATATTRVPFDQVLALVAHVPSDRAAAVGEELAKGPGVRWLPSGSVTVERSETDRMYAIVRGEGGAVRVLLSVRAGVQAQLDAEEALARLRR